MLVLDRNPDWLARSLRAFAAAGYPTSTAVTVEEAIAALRRRRAVLLVLGPTVPRWVSDRLRRHLREDDNPGCPILALRTESSDL
ncbi:MAG TPA: hypothetical protein VHM30_05425 [Gemmatimonadaceae bacterium]|nr:hypothetical protein [Gemmatimonadaceae bacterium]